MVTTRSGTKRASLDESGIAALEDRAGKRQKRLPVRRKSDAGKDGIADQEGAPAEAESSPVQDGDEKDGAPLEVADEDEKVVPEDVPVALVEDVPESAPAPVPSSKVEPEAVIEDSEEEEGSDDEAPEAVSTTAAAAEAKKASQASRQAAREQAATLKKKRRARDALLKEKAQSRKEAIPAVETTRKRQERTEIPDLLPASFLESDDEDSSSPNLSLTSMPRKKFKPTVEKPVQDKVVGSTIYRVQKAPGNNLPPKNSSESAARKKVLLKRGRAAVVAGKGFVKRVGGRI